MEVTVCLLLLTGRRRLARQRQLLEVTRSFKKIASEILG